MNLRSGIGRLWSLRPDQRGAGTVLVLAMTGLVMVLGAGLAVASGLVLAQRRAQAAADLAALAAAGEGGCAAADRIAGANGATLIDCMGGGGNYRVRVRVPGPHWLGQTHDLTAEARAGRGTG